MGAVLARGMKTSTVPGPYEWPVVGSLPDFVSRSGGVPAQMNKMHNEYYAEFGPLYRLNLLGENDIVTCHPEDYLQVYRNEGQHPPGGAEMLWMVKRWATERGLDKVVALNSNGPSWREVRDTMQEDIVAPKTARSYLPFINEACSLASTHFAANASKPDTFGTHLAFDMFTALLYGLQMQTSSQKAAAEDMDFVKTTKQGFSLIGTLLFKPYLNMPIFANHKLNVEFQDCFDRSYKRAGELLQIALQKEWKDPKPYLHRVFESGRMPREDIEQTVMVMLLAGVDTTQSVINWNLLYLAQNPDKQDILYEELQTALSDGPLTAEALASGLPYLKAVVRETHRLAPPSPIMTSRKAPCDMTFGDHSVAAGTKVSFQILSLQNDPKFVDNPSEFQPERWLPEQVQQRRGTSAEIIDHKLLATPFSFGSRMCLGGRVAQAEIFAVLARLVRDWRWTVQETTDWKTIQPLMTKADPFPSFEIHAR
eukprot:gnl/MRDRNA2_/MRDRNA2_247689_c0_seq1.p1 gnl/MRDRNA2_/MRDRNA2_247689_c0~~gnl/MRDRNA2_/MRDRNA2_247689_c0_seq1.p1  ORF type:complete len:490 (-),score=84.06 gnl/MRDRNA2_/MRDRNA2_247689_c0_seq1:17-1459(-)